MSIIPLTDASRRPAAFPVVTLSIIVINVIVFVLELVYGDAKEDQVLGQHALPMSYSKRELDGSYRYDINLKPTQSGSFAYNVRVVPYHTGLTEKYEMGLIRWA